ncbi:MAG: hypothetical protein HY718_03530, partial [Planctomycetes bacterium]|nr:hypothetical protein [Planctomycetota bacterium]
AAAAEAWDTSQRTIRFKCESDQVLNLHFAGKPIDDFYGYNYSQNGQHPAQQRLPVGDLRLAFTWFPDAGDGGLVLEMNRDRDLFTARIRMDGTVQVDHLAGAAKVPVALGTGPVKLDPFALGRAVEVEFVNVDFRVSLTIDGREVVASTDKQYAPNLAELLSRDTENRPDQTVPSAVKIGAYRLQCRLDHVELDRDVYYRSSSMPEVASPPGQPTGSYRPRQNVFFRWPGWGTQGRPILLRDGDAREYFMLGDNSPGSKDSRLWWEIGPHLYHLGEQYQVGTVPEDQLIGQAFFVYWPGGYRRSWTADIGAIPNFGRMRWIR